MNNRQLIKGFLKGTIGPSNEVNQALEFINDMAMDRLLDRIEQGDPVAMDFFYRQIAVAMAHVTAEERKQNGWDKFKNLLLFRE